jgi:hypothetical protein
MTFDEADNHVGAARSESATLVEHRDGLSYPCRRTQIDPEATDGIRVVRGARDVGDERQSGFGLGQVRARFIGMSS